MAILIQIPYLLTNNMTQQQVISVLLQIRPESEIYARFYGRGDYLSSYHQALII
jgi:hypothetical protein